MKTFATGIYAVNPLVISNNPAETVAQGFGEGSALVLAKSLLAVGSLPASQHILVNMYHQHTGHALHCCVICNRHFLQ